MGRLDQISSLSFTVSEKTDEAFSWIGKLINLRKLSIQVVPLKISTTSSLTSQDPPKISLAPLTTLKLPNLEEMQLLGFDFVVNQDLSVPLTHQFPALKQFSARNCTFEKEAWDLSLYGNENLNFAGPIRRLALGKFKNSIEEVISKIHQNNPQELSFYGSLDHLILFLKAFPNIKKLSLLQDFSLNNKKYFFHPQFIETIFSMKKLEHLNLCFNDYLYDMELSQLDWLNHLGNVQIKIFNNSLKEKNISFKSSQILINGWNNGLNPWL